MATNVTENEPTNVTENEPVCTGTEINASQSEKASRKRENSLPGTDSTVSDQSEGDYCPPLKKFEVVPSEREYSYNFTEDQRDYIVKHFATYISDHDLKSCILNKSPVPENVPGPSNLDSYLRALLEEKTKSPVVAEDKSSQKVQQKKTDVLGPLSKIWSLMQRALSAQPGEIEVALEEVNELVEQSVLLLGQANNAVTYLRRVRVLSALMKDTKSKQLLKEKSLLLSNMGEDLFGKKFRDDWCSSMKTKQKCQELLKKEFKGSYTPFRGGSLNRGRGSRGRGYFVRKDYGSSSTTTSSNSGAPRGNRGYGGGYRGGYRRSYRGSN
ncbi:uncharacterized protein LOC130624302 [Hydractinia symbiolongicarpus]|uniref:uncharacterized protein LOC130624302 n=1 Tax=Hydractinia symbiolongicarpus TaxID=13093 RepID=UPI002549FC5F|nr:uncharacterized protein LOC130624302 [Hydractinia symbiolongicarpus]